MKTALMNILITASISVMAIAIEVLRSYLS
jgi:hypothetical protein